MAIVLPVVSLATGDRIAPKLSVQDLRVICRVTCTWPHDDGKGMFDHRSNISPKFVPKSLYSKVNFEFEDVVPFSVSADCPQISVKGKLFKDVRAKIFLW